jgi:hypothetical protein
MAKRYPRERGPSVSTKIPIYTLSGGVSRQAQSKRLPNEAENMDNALVSLERSFEKRPGFEIITQNGSTWNQDFSSTVSNGNRLDLFPLAHSTGTNKDYWFYWFNINDDNRFLVVVDYKATTANSVLFYAFKLNTDNTWTDVTSYSNTPTNTQQDTTIVSTTTRDYITYGNATNKAQNVLKATTVGNSIIIVNTLVKAGFTSNPTGASSNKLFNLDGTVSATNDTKGLPITYYSAARYTKGADSKWYLNTKTGQAKTITKTGGGNFADGDTVSIGVALGDSAYPSGIVEGNASTSAPVTTNPSSQNKYYAVLSSTNWMILSGWASGATSFSVEKVYGTCGSGSSYTVYTGYYPEVEDFIWHDTSQPWLGQSLADFSEIRFPPELAERNGNNGIVLNNIIHDSTAKTMLANLYPNDGNTSGNGKVYYTAAPYLNFTSGYYRIISSTSKPYTKKVRSPDAFSVLDERRMPQKISFNAGASPVWTANPISWEPRTSGNRYSNPGPSVFLSNDKTTGRQVQIKAISTFRDRLYFAAEDVVFTSQLGVYEDLFLADPSNIVATDPIDIRASSNTFSEISSLTPFNTYLFINTLGNVQYELKGSQNQITPLTAEISPTAFYSTAKFIEPQLMGSLIYFFDSSKLYLYLSSESQDLAIAQELTVTCPDYLPNNYRGVCVAPAQNYIISTDDDNPNYTYFHASRFAGDKNLQNALFRYIFNSNDAVMSNQSYDDHLYSVFRRSTTGQIGTGYIDNDPATIDSFTTTGLSQQFRYYIERSYLRNQSTDIPRLDRLIKVRLYDNNSDYDPTTQQTKIKLPLSFINTDVSKLQLITDSSWATDPEGDRVYEIATPIAYTINNGYIELVFTGRYVPAILSSGVITIDYTTPTYIWIGIKYKMEVELSTQFVRDQTNNTIDGVLNLRTMTTRHKKTGNYDIVVANRGRTPVVSSFTNQKVDNNQDLLNLENYEEEGEFVTNILGFSDTTNIKIVSEYPTPVNIVNMEIKGKFIQKYSAI